MKITDDMVDAACNATIWDRVLLNGSNDMILRTVLQAAFAAAPKVGGWVWCDAELTVCAACRRTTTGYARIGVLPYCHDGRDCYRRHA